MTQTDSLSGIYEIVEYEAAYPEVQVIYDEIKNELGLPFIINWFKCQGNNAALLKGNWEKLRNTLFRGEVPVLLKQLIIYNISAKKGCSYCKRAHSIFANVLGRTLYDDADFKITDDLDKLPASFAYSTAIKIVTKAALTPSSINDEDIDELSDAGFTPNEIRELLAQADLVNMLNTIADISHIKIDNELLELEG